MRAKLAALVEDAKALEQARQTKREMSVAKFKEEQARCAEDAKAAKIETEAAHRGGSEAREDEMKKGDAVRAELEAERIAEKKADLKKMREKAAARKAGFEAMMNAADGAGPALAQEINHFRKLAAQRTKEADAKNAAERKKKRLEIVAMNKKYEAKMAETFKRQDEEMKKRLAEYNAHAEKDAKAQAAHAEQTMAALKKALSGEHLKAPRRRRGETEAAEDGEEGDAREPDGDGDPGEAAAAGAAAGETRMGTVFCDRSSRRRPELSSNIRPTFVRPSIRSFARLPRDRGPLLTRPPGEPAHQPRGATLRVAPSLRRRRRRGGSTGRPRSPRRRERRRVHRRREVRKLRASPRVRSGQPSARPRGGLAGARS